MTLRLCVAIIGVVSILSTPVVAETPAGTTSAVPTPAPAAAALCVRFYNDPETIKFYTPFEDFTICSGQASRRVETYADFPMKFECVNPNGQVIGCGIERKVSPDYCTGTPTQRKVTEGQVIWNSYEPSSLKNCTQQYRATEETWTVAAAAADGQSVTTDITAYVYLPILEISTTEFSKHGWISPWYTTEHPQGMTLTFNMRSDNSQQVCTTYRESPPPRPINTCFYHCGPNANPDSCRDNYEYCIHDYDRKMREYELALHHHHYYTECKTIRDSFTWTTERANDYFNSQLKPSSTLNLPPNNPLSHFDTLDVVMTDDLIKWYDARMTLHGLRVVLPYWYCDITGHDGSFATTGIIVDHFVESKTFPKFLSGCKEWKLRPHPLSDSEL